MYIYSILYTYDVCVDNYIYNTTMQLHIQKLRWQNFLHMFEKTLQTYNNLTFGYSNLQPSSFDVTFVHVPPWLSPRAHGRRCGANPMRRPPGLWTQRCQPRCGRPLRRPVVPTGRFRGSWTLWRNMGCNWRSLTQKFIGSWLNPSLF